MTEPFKMEVERESVIKKFHIQNIEGYITVGLREDGTPGEVFLMVQQCGTFARGLCHALGLMISVALQSGTPLNKIVEKLKDLHFEPSGITGDPAIPFCNSITDYLAKWLSMRFLEGEEK